MRASSIVLALFAAALLAPPDLLAQTATPAPAEAAPAPAEQPVSDAGAQIDEILAGEEAVLAGGAYSYDPGNRRDPFRSLVVSRDRQAVRGPLPEGIPGLLIDEIDLTGVFKTSRGFVAQVVASNKAKSYLLREGDQLYDGDVVGISQNEVVFKQIVNDPTVIKPFREVVKKLSP
jgi:Tfp pilus assembly protein PilP